jgi:hypothetical protein
MLTKTISYEDLDGVQQTETFWFQLTEGEITKQLIVGGEGGETLKDRLERLGNLTEEDMKNGAGRQVMDTFENILRAAVGKRTGNLFRKNDEIRDNFMYSGAYDAFFLEMLQTRDSGASYIKAMLPGKVHVAIDEAVAKQMQDTQQEASTTVATTLQTAPPVLESEVVELPSVKNASDEPKWLSETRYPTPKELMAMGKDEMRLAMKMKADKIFG